MVLMNVGIISWEGGSGETEERIRNHGMVSHVEENASVIQKPLIHICECCSEAVSEGERAT
jgi:hypothetical protein